MYADCSVVIPTIEERVSQLYGLLNQLVKCVEKPGEVIIVSDGIVEESLLDKIVAAYESEGIRLKLIKTTKGLTTSAHRNIGLKVASRKYILFIDDDILPKTNWLSEMRKTLNNGADVVGGSSEALFVKGTKPPLWWDEALLGGYVAVGNSYISAKTGAIWSCNLAIRKEMTKKITFDEAIGLRRGTNIYGEDAKFVKRAISCGANVVFNSRAIVHHKINERRLRFEYQKTRALHEGFSLRIVFGFNIQMILKYMIIKFLRGIHLSLWHRRKTIPLLVYLLFSLCEGVGWLECVFERLSISKACYEDGKLIIEEAEQAMKKGVWNMLRFERARNSVRHQQLDLG